MSERTATRIGAATLSAAGFAAAAWLLLRTEVPADLAPRPVDLRAPEAEDYARLARLFWLGRTATELGVLVALAAAGAALARRLRFGVVVLLAVLAALWLAGLPWGAAAHWWRRRHGLSTQGYGAWLVDPWLELLVGAAVACVALVVGMVLARRLGRRWWLAGGPLLAVVGAVVVLVQPLVMAPRLEPLREPALDAEIRALGRELGVTVDRVEVKAARERTTRINAEVSGYGPTRRVILWDTLLDGRASDGEIRFISAHELAHVARRHVWKGVAWFALLAVPITFVIAEATRWRGGLGEARTVPLAVLAVAVVQLALLAPANAISRRYEAEADWVAFRATQDPAAATALFRRLVEENLGDPSPPRWAYVLLSTHPSLSERIGLIEAATRRPASREGS